MVVIDSRSSIPVHADPNLRPPDSRAMGEAHERQQPLYKTRFILATDRVSPGFIARKVRKRKHKRFGLTLSRTSHKTEPVMYIESNSFSTGIRMHAMESWITSEVSDTPSSMGEVRHVTGSTVLGNCLLLIAMSFRRSISPETTLCVSIDLSDAYPSQ